MSGLLTVCGNCWRLIVLPKFALKTHADTLNKQPKNPMHHLTHRSVKLVQYLV